MKDKINIKVKDHSRLDKSFRLDVGGLASMKVAYDDENHPEVDAAVDYIVSLLQEHWDKNQFKHFHKDRLIKEWESNQDLKDDYNDLEDYLTNWL